jgi:hypothetical protein
MKNRRLGLALVIAVIISVTATFFLYSRIKRQYALNAQANQDCGRLPSVGTGNATLG